MQTIDRMRRSGVGIDPAQTVRQAAAAMEASGIGALAVVEHERVVGIVTDRDLVRRALARGLPDDARVDAVMTTPVATLDAGTDVHDAYALIRRYGVRRLPVTRDGRFVGMVTLDDLLVELARDLGDLARTVRAEIDLSDRDSPLPATRS